MPVVNARLNSFRFSLKGAVCPCAAALLIFLFGATGPQCAMAAGATRTLSTAGEAYLTARARLAKLFSLKTGARRRDGGATSAAAGASASAPMPAAANGAGIPANPLLAALEREARHKRGTASSPPARGPHQADKRAAALPQPKLINAADVTARPQQQGANDAAVTGRLTPKQIIRKRGYWGGPPASDSVALPARSSTASGAETTGSISPPAGAGRDRRRAVRVTALNARLGGRVPSGRIHLPPPATTIARKRTADESASVVVSAPVKPLRQPKRPMALRAAQSLNPWLLAIVMSPNIRRFLTTQRLGAPDFRTLLPLVRKPKPKRVVLMTFGSAPDANLSPDHFGGRAVVFLSTLTSTAGTAARGTHAASLR